MLIFINNVLYPVTSSEILTTVFFPGTNSFVSITSTKRERKLITQLRVTHSARNRSENTRRGGREIFSATTRPLITCHLVRAQKGLSSRLEKSTTPTTRESNSLSSSTGNFGCFAREAWPIPIYGNENALFRGFNRDSLSLSLDSNPLRACVPNDIVEWLNIIPPLNAADLIDFFLNLCSILVKQPKRLVESKFY